MSTGVFLVVGIGIFAMLVGVIGWFLGEDDREELKLREVHATRQVARDPWD